jgi:hypothetical protein
MSTFLKPGNNRQPTRCPGRHAAVPSRRASAVRERIPSLAHAFEKCASAVSTLANSRAATVEVDGDAFAGGERRVAR